MDGLNGLPASVAKSRKPKITSCAFQSLKYGPLAHPDGLIKSDTCIYCIEVSKHIHHPIVRPLWRIIRVPCYLSDSKSLKYCTHGTLDVCTLNSLSCLMIYVESIAHLLSIIRLAPYLHLWARYGWKNQDLRMLHIRQSPLEWQCWWSSRGKRPPTILTHYQSLDPSLVSWLSCCFPCLTEGVSIRSLQYRRVYYWNTGSSDNPIFQCDNSLSCTAKTSSSERPARKSTDRRKLFSTQRNKAPAL